MLRGGGHVLVVGPFLFFVSQKPVVRNFAGLPFIFNLGM